MTNWKSDELEKFGKVEEIKIAGLRSDGTLHKPVIIWIVRVGNDLYVRSVKGRTAGWFRGTQIRHEGSIWADSAQQDVTFVEENDPVVNELVDAAYLSKYRQYPQWVAPMVVPEVKGTTLKLVPR
jgi:hypothetical protein